MDPTSFGFVAATAVLIIIVSIIVFRMYPKETDFEKAYGENALRLLTEDKMGKAKNAKNKSKAKNVEKKKELANEDKESSVEKPRNGVYYTPVDTWGQPNASGKSSIPDAGESDTKPSRKKYRGSPLITGTKQRSDENEPAAGDDVLKGAAEESAASTEPPSENLVEEPELSSSSLQLTSDENKESDAFGRKSRKKHRVRRVDEHLPEMQKKEIDVAEHETVTFAQTIAPLESEERKPKKAAPRKDIDAERFQERLNALTDLEPEYVTFITNYFKNVTSQKARHSDEIALIRKQLADKERLVLQYTDRLVAAEAKDSEIALLQETLAVEKKKYRLFEQTVCSQMSSSAQEKAFLQRKCEQLQTDLSAEREKRKKAESVIHATPPPVDTKPYQQQIDMLKAELASTEKRCSQVEMERNQNLQSLQQYKNESQNRNRKMDHLMKSNALLEKRVKEIETTAKAERDALEIKLQNAMELADELVAVALEIHEEILQHKENAETAVQTREECCEKIRILNAQLSDAGKERASILNDCTSYSKRLAEMEAANKELRALQSISDANRNELEKELERYRQQLLESQKRYQEDTAKLENKLTELREERDEIGKKSVDLTNEVEQMTQLCKELEEFKSEYNKKLGRIKFLEAEVAKYKKIQEKRQTSYNSLANSADKTTEEIMKVAHMHGAQAKPSDDEATSSDSAEKLKQGISDLKKQNEELRETSYKVVEIAQQQENVFKKHLEELEENYENAFRRYRSEVSKTLFAISPPNTKLPHVPNPCDTEQFCEWLRSAETVLQKSEIGQVKNKSNKTSKEDSDVGKILELEANNRRYRAALVALSAHIDAIEKEVVLKEKSYLQEISHLRQEISKHLKVQLEKELKRKEELITQASKLCDVINGPSKQQGNVNRTHGIDDSNVSAAIVMADDDWEVVMDP